MNSGGMVLPGLRNFENVWPQKFVNKLNEENIFSEMKNQKYYTAVMHNSD